jgi:hypothetical protein
LLSHEATQPTFCTQCSVSCVGNGSSHPTVATYASADHKFNAEPSSPLSLHHRWMCPLGVESRHVRRKRHGAIKWTPRCLRQVSRPSSGWRPQHAPTHRSQPG